MNRAKRLNLVALPNARGASSEITGAGARIVPKAGVMPHVKRSKTTRARVTDPPNKRASTKPRSAGPHGIRKTRVPIFSRSKDRLNLLTKLVGAHGLEPWTR